jgi:hypothetical protein
MFQNAAAFIAVVIFFGGKKREANIASQYSIQEDKWTKQHTWKGKIVAE